MRAVSVGMESSFTFKLPKEGDVDNFPSRLSSDRAKMWGNGY